MQPGGTDSFARALSVLVVLGLASIGCFRSGYDAVAGDSPSDASFDASGEDGGARIDADLSNPDVGACPTTEGDICPHQGVNLSDGVQLGGDTRVNEAGKLELCGHPDGAEATITLTSSGSGIYDLAVSADFDAVLYLIESCETRTLASSCIDDAPAGELETLVLEAASAESFTLVIDSSDGLCGTYSVSIDARDPS